MQDCINSSTSEFGDRKEAQVPTMEICLFNRSKCDLQALFMNVFHFSTLCSRSCPHHDCFAVVWMTWAFDEVIVVFYFLFISEPLIPISIPE